MTKFKYGDKVEVTKGFYKGCRGEVVGTNAFWSYEVLFTFQNTITHTIPVTRLKLIEART